MSRSAWTMPDPSNNPRGNANPHEAGSVSYTPFVPAPVDVRILAAARAGVSSIQQISCTVDPAAALLLVVPNWPDVLTPVS